MCEPINGRSGCPHVSGIAQKIEQRAERIALSGRNLQYFYGKVARGIMISGVIGAGQRCQLLSVPLCGHNLDVSRIELAAIPDGKSRPTRTNRTGCRLSVPILDHVDQ